MDFDNIFTRSKKSKTFISNAGTKFLDEYAYDGSDTLVKVGKTNVYDKIQAAAPAQDINFIVAKFLNGDTDALNSVHGIYGDFSNMPTTYAELFDRVRTCKDLFGSLPSDIRNEFDNNPYEFWTKFGTAEFDAIVSKFNVDPSANTTPTTPVVEPIKESEVK